MTLIASEAENFERIRTAAGTPGGNSGRPTTGAQTTTTFTDGNFQSVVADDVETLPEGERSRAEYKLWTSADLRGADQYQGLPADKVRRLKNGTMFEVREITDVGDLLPDEKFILLRVQES